MRGILILVLMTDGREVVHHVGSRDELDAYTNKALSREDVVSVEWEVL